jgi:putative spermidine/putrescine transport system substrate-binding protein
MNRRDFFLGSAAAIGGLSLSAADVAAQSNEVVFNGAGGTWQDTVRKAWLGPFTEKTGIKVTDTFPFDLGKMSAMVRTNTAQWDLTDCPSSFLGPAIAQKLIEPIDYKIVDLTALPQENLGKEYVAYGVFSSNIVYDKRRFPAEAPASWRDFWDLKRFPGPRAFRKQPMVALEAALIADGVPLNRLYPLDVDRAYKKLEQIKSEVRWWSNAQQSVQIIAQGEVVMGVTFPSRAFAARDQGVPLEVVWNEGLMARTRFVVPRGARNKENAMRLLAFIIQPEQQARFATLNRSAPVNPKAYELIDKSLAPILATYPANFEKMTAIDELDYWTINADSLTKRFEAWLVA